MTNEQTRSGYVVTDAQVLQELLFIMDEGFHNKLATYDFVHPQNGSFFISLL